MKETGILVRKLELKPSRTPIWAFLRLYLTHKGDNTPTQCDSICLFVFLSEDNPLRTTLSDTFIG